MKHSHIMSVAVAALCGGLAGPAATRAADVSSVPAASGQVAAAALQAPVVPTIAIPLFVDATGYMAVHVPGMTGTQSGFAARSQPIEVAVRLGTQDNEFALAPAQLKFETGKFYKLVITNPSSVAHYISTPLFADNVHTRTVLLYDGDRNVASFHEGKRWGFRNTVAMRLKAGLEIKPGGKAEWFFVPVDAGRFSYSCTTPSHLQAGMAGEISVGG